MRVPILVGRATALIMLGGASALAQSTPATPQPVTSQVTAMEKVTGIGGFFFRAKDPKALAEWYQTHLGISTIPTTYEAEPWTQEKGPTAFAPFKADTKYFGRETQQFMLNFRVRDLDAMVAQLERAGIKVEVNKETYPNGRFARTHDPEGNPIELWEPKRPAGAKTPEP